MFGKRFQLSLFCLPSEPLVVRKHEITGKMVAHDLSSVCVQIYTILLCESRASNETEFQKWEYSCLCFKCILESSFCYWLQISSVSPRYLFIYQINFQIKLNVDFKVSKIMFFLDFYSESLWFYGWSILLTVSRWNFVLSCTFFYGEFLKKDWQLKGIFSLFCTRSSCRVKSLWRVLESFQNCSKLLDQQAVLTGGSHNFSFIFIMFFPEALWFLRLPLLVFETYGI